MASRVPSFGQNQPAPGCRVAFARLEMASLTAGISVGMAIDRPRPMQFTSIGASRLLPTRPNISCLLHLKPGRAPSRPAGQTRDDGELSLETRGKRPGCHHTNEAQRGGVPDRCAKTPNADETCPTDGRHFSIPTVDCHGHSSRRISQCQRPRHWTRSKGSSAICSLLQR